MPCQPAGVVIVQYRTLCVCVQVNHLLYMKLKAQGLVELLDTHPPAWRAAGSALPPGHAAAAHKLLSPDQADATAPAAQAAAGEGEACSQGPCAVGHADRGSTGIAGGRGPACAAAAVSATASASRTTSEAPGSELLGEVSSAAARLRFAAAAAAAAPGSIGAGRCSGSGAALPGVDGAASHGRKQGVQASPVAAQRLAGWGLSKAANTSPAASSAGGIPRPTGSGGGVRGSCSPAPAAAYRQKQLQQQPGEHSGGLQGSRCGMPAAAQSDGDRYRHHHMQRDRHQQQQLLPGATNILQSAAAFSQVQLPALQHSRHQQALQQHGLQLVHAAVGHSSDASPAAKVQQQQQQHHQQQQHQGQEQVQCVGLDALLLPQTLAAVAGLGLLDPSEPGFMPCGAAGDTLGGRYIAAADIGATATATAAAAASVSGAGQSANSYGHTPRHTCSQEQHSFHPQSHAQAAAAQQRCEQYCAAAGSQPLHSCRQAVAGGADSDEDISPAVLAAANEAASLEPAPFDSACPAHSTGSIQHQHDQQQQQQQQQGHWLQWQQQREPLHGFNGVAARQRGTTDLQSGHVGGGLLQHVDLLAAMHINEQPGFHTNQHIAQGLSTLDAVVPDSAMRARGSSSRPVAEAGTKRKYPVYISAELQAAVAGADAAAGQDANGNDGTGAGHGSSDMQLAGAGMAAEQPSGMVGITQPQLQLQLQQKQQHQLLLQEQEDRQQQPPQPDCDQVHPQRRRRRSGQGVGFSGRGLGGTVGHKGLGHLVSHDGQAAAGATDGDDGVGSSDDMQEFEAGPGAAFGIEAAHAGAGIAVGAAAADLPPALLRRPARHLVFEASAGPVTDQQQQLCGPNPWQGLWQHSTAERTPGPYTAGAAGGRRASAGEDNPPLGSTWSLPGNGSSSNPWQWQGQQQAWQQPVTVLPAHTQTKAADSEGNGSCLGWPAAAGVASQQHKQQELQRKGLSGFVQQQQQWACSQGPVLGRPASPMPCVSGLSVGASAVSGGHRASEEPMQAAAAGQEVTQPTRRRSDVQACPGQQQQQHRRMQELQQEEYQQQRQQQQAPDWQQSEEQALQLLSRLALPPAGPDALASAAAVAAQHAAPADGAAPVPSGPGGCAAVHMASQAGAAAAVAAGPTDAAAVQGDCLTVAMAAAAAAAQAAAAVASAAGLVAPQQQQQQHTMSAAAAGNKQLQPPDATFSDHGAGAVMPGPAAAADIADGAGTAHGEGAPAGGEAATSVARPELQAEYERRVGAVRDLVQQLNEALQGLNSLQEQVSRPCIPDSSQ